MKSSELRKKAEEVLKNISSEVGDIPLMSLEELIHELHTHQIELEMQNDELNKANAEILQSERKYSNLYHNAPCGYLTLDSQRIIVEANLMASTLLGVKRDQLLGNNVTTFISPEDQGKVQEHYLQVLEMNSWQIAECRTHNHPPGAQYIHIETVAEDIKPDKSYIYKTVLMDVTERKQKERQIKKLSCVVDDSPLAIIITDKSGNIEYVNSQLLKISGYHEYELIGKNPRIFQSGKSPQKYYEDMWKTISSGKDWRGVFHNKKKNGELYWESALVFPLKDAEGIIVNFIGLKEDITEKKQMESTLIDHERLISSVINSLNDGLIISNMDGKIQLFNKRAEKIFGYTAKEVMNKPVTILMNEANKVKHDSGMDSFRKTKTLSGSKALMDIEGLKKNGSPVPIELVLTQMEQGGEMLIIGMIRDITEQKLTEKIIKTAEEQVLEAQKLAAIGELAAGVSHEVMNPVNIISVHTQMLQRKATDDPKIQSFSSKVMHEIERIKKIMGSMLAFSRKGNSELHKGFVRDTIENVVGLVEAEYKLDNIKVVRNWCDDPVEIQYDPDKIRQVYLNLFQNAKHAMPSGGTITVGCEAVEIDGKNFHQFTFSDTGTGMSEGVRLKIFEPFFTTKPEGEGTGMGLSVIHGIVESHGGTISVESEEGKGTVFKINLPVV